MENVLEQTRRIGPTENRRVGDSENRFALSPIRRLPARLPLWKRALDLGIILLLSPVIVPVAALIALAIKLGSPGPVMFRQQRVGYKGQRFLCYKFRSMKVGAETESHRGHTTQLMKSEKPMTKLDARKDPRIVPLGAILRSTGLDELPQLLNVLRGEMSLVGPRPCIPYEFEGYEPWQRRRFDAVPGLTGLWQVSGKNRTTFNQMIRLDIKYSEQANLWLDLKIIFKTVPALVVQCHDNWLARSKKREAAGRATAGSATAASATAASATTGSATAAKPLSATPVS